ncbi:hypothetical protein [Paenibacillus sp. DYY-L-2]|uniref:hypothetical protein n=1 Tax=Paenibacillus sp. DYY-L-2 TaxID=3447013 RepID=UPI003F504114
MAYFTNERARQILANEISVETLLTQYPEFQAELLKELETLKGATDSKLTHAILRKYSANAQMANKKIRRSGYNETTVNAFLPVIIKARFAMHLLEHLAVAASSSGNSKKARLNLWDGAILQKLLFKKDFERKPVSMGLFKFFWRLVGDKKLLMPLVNKKGIYCFYSKALIKELSRLIGSRKCIEIAAGDGTLTRFLNKYINCKATDDYSWAHYITYPSSVEKADAKTALQKYSPEVVICSWPVPDNTYEKHVFKTGSVDLYIVIGTKDPALTGDFDAYNTIGNTGSFSMEMDERLSSLILPPSDQNAVFIFRRIKPNSEAVQGVS